MSESGTPLPRDASTAQVHAAALDAVDAGHDDAIDLLERLVAIPSVGGSIAEVEIQHVLADVLHGDGFDIDLWRIDLDELVADPDFPGMEVERTQAYGLVATLPGHAPDLGRSLLVDGHTDVVPPGHHAAWTSDPFTLRRTERDGRELLIGRGVCDMKAGLVASIAAARALRALGVRLAGDLTIAPVVGEEDGGLGTFALLRRGVTADACVVPEPTDLDVIPANGGALTFRLRVPGRAIHASRRTEGVSAIEKFTYLNAALHRFEAERNADVDPLLRRWPLAYPLSIGTVHAGDWASTVPDLLVAEDDSASPCTRHRRRLERRSRTASPARAPTTTSCVTTPCRCNGGAASSHRDARTTSPSSTRCSTPTARPRRAPASRRSTARPTAATCACWRRT